MSGTGNSSLLRYQGLLGAIRHAPIGCTITIAAASGAVLCGGFGIEAVLHAPRELAFAGAAALTGTQMLLYAMRDRFRYGRRVAFMATAGFFVIVAVNISMIAGGLAALQPDRLGQAFIWRNLQPTMVATERAVADLEGLADAVEDIGQYSAAKNAKERGISVPYAGTCPGSHGKGDGPAAAYRQFYADSFQGTLERPGYALVARAEAKAARADLEAAKAIAVRYKLATHDANIDAIGAKVNSVVGHVRAAKAPAILAALDQHQEQAADGRWVMVRGRSMRVKCPDTELDGYVAAARQVRSTGSDGVVHVSPRVPPTLPPAFAGIERPSEETAVTGLFEEEKRAALFAGLWLVDRFGMPAAAERFPDVALGPWSMQLFVAPGIDVGLLLGLQAIGFRLRRRRTIEDEIAFRLGESDLQPDEVRPAMARAARSEHLCRLKAHLHTLVIGPFTGKVMAVPVSETDLVITLQQICRSGGARDAHSCLGEHLPDELFDERIDPAAMYRLFVLDDGTWDRIEGDEIVRQARLMRAEAAEPPSLDPYGQPSGEEPTKQTQDRPGEAANDTFAAGDTGTQN